LSRKEGWKMNTLENTIQYIRPTEKARFMIDFKAKKDTNILLFWHYETIKEELIDNYLLEKY
jgi:hypothetical protein